MRLIPDFGLIGESISGNSEKSRRRQRIMGKRAAGILMPVSSLPSDYGIGCFSKSAYEFVDWLKEAGQT